jgi:predicted lipid-binding transport protein (Tim44 family)
MSAISKWLLAAFTLVLGTVFVAPDVEARRFGGARSLGAQRTITPPPAKPAQQQQAAPAKQGQQPAQQQQGKWGPILGGLALGGLLGYLFAGNGLAGLLVLALLAAGAVLLFRALARRAQQAPVQFAGMREQTMLEPSPGAALPAGAARVPSGFDASAFLRGARMNFVKLQVANDAGDLAGIREFTTDELFEALKPELLARGAQRQRTEVSGLQADLLEVATEGDRHWASVRFSGAIRESDEGVPATFEEVWNLVKPADGSSGWLVAGIQQMH